MKNKTMKMTEDEFREANNSHFGFCKSCGMINDGFHEPDAENYKCDHCGEMASDGFENALIGMLVDIVENQEESNYEDRF